MERRTSSVSFTMSAVHDGEDGKGISSADVMFCIISGTGTPADTADWQTTVAQLSLSDSTKEYYLWQATYITYTDGTHAYTGKVCLGQVKDFAAVTEQYATGTASAATSNWQDNTPPALQKGSYLWTRTKLVFANGNTSYQPSEDGYCLGYYGEDGTSPWFADLDNEMDSVACDADGRPVSATTLETTVSLWHGSTLQDITSVKVDGTDIKTTPTAIGIFSVKYVVVETKKRKIQVTVGTTNVLPLTNSLAIEISDGTETRSLSFVINGVRPGSNGQPATVFSLVPSTSAIKKDKGGTLSPASPMTCNVLKKVGNAAAVNATSDDGTLRYSVDGDITSSTQGADLAINTGLVTFAATNSYITFAFFVGTTLVDKERVPVVYDGTDGNDAILYTIESNVQQIVIPADSTYVLSQQFDFRFLQQIGQQEKQRFPASFEIWTRKKDGTYERRGGGVSTSTVNVSYTVHSTWDALVIVIGHPYTTPTIAGAGTATSDDYLCKLEIPILKNGDTGQSITGPAGHVGRWYYYAGEWNGGSYTMQETQAPFVKGSDGNFYMLDFGTSGYSTGTTSQNPVYYHNPASGSGSNPWTLMQSQMQYYIAKAFFGEYAQFGSFIINGDWMISTKGVRGSDSDSQEYTYFDPNTPTASTYGSHTRPNGSTFYGYNFAPNFAVDGLTGRSYQNDVYVRGTIHAELVYSGYKEINLNHTITVDNATNTYIVRTDLSGATITLPDPDTCPGLTMKFLLLRLARDSGGAQFSCGSSDNKKIMGLDDEGYIAPFNLYGLTPNRLMEVISMEDMWYITKTD